MRRRRADDGVGGAQPNMTAARRCPQFAPDHPSVYEPPEHPSAPVPGHHASARDPSDDDAAPLQVPVSSDSAPLQRPDGTDDLRLAQRRRSADAAAAPSEFERAAYDP